MGMVVRSNLMAVNAQRQLGMNTSQVSKALEKLSSGYRINRAGDDASGLAISEKMKAQIKGLEAASLNSQDGVSVVQTAEGALTEVHNMLNRMTELATRSANGINNDQNRQSLQDEIKELQTEIDRISQSTNFNGINLLDGTMDRGGLPTFSGMPEGAKVTTTAATGNANELTIVKADGVDGKTYSMDVTFTNASGKSETITLKLTGGKDGNNGTLTTENGTVIKAAAADGNLTAAEVADAFAKAAKENSTLNGLFDIKNATDKLTFTSKATGTANKVEVLKADTMYDATAGTAASKVTKGADEKVTYDFEGFDLEKVFTIDGKKFAFSADNTTAKKFGDDVNVIVLEQASGGNIAANDVGHMAALMEQKYGMKVADNGKKLTFTADADNGGLSLQIGDTADNFNQLNLAIKDMSSAGIGIDGVDISSREGAAEAIDTIRAAIDKVSSQRATLGATQNRLEYTINNLDTASENIQAANSRIRDTDMAKMMMEYTKTNVLTQSAQAMLAQANQQPQSVLQLLQ